MATNIDKTVTITTVAKDQASGDITTQVKKITGAYEQLKKTVKEVNGTITTTTSTTGKGLSKLGTHFGALGKAVGGVQKSITGLFGKLVAFEAIKKVFKGLYDSFAMFEKASGGKSLEKLSTGFKNLQIQVGSVLAENLAPLAEWFTKNEEQIGKVARAITSGLVTAFKVLGVALKTIWDLISPLVYLLGTGIAESISLMLRAITLLPDFMIPPGWKKSINEISVAADKLAFDLAGKAVNAGRSWGDNFKENVTKGLDVVTDALGKGIPVKVNVSVKSSVKSTDAEIEKIKQEISKLEEEYITAFESIEDAEYELGKAIANENSTITTSFELANLDTQKSLQGIIDKLSIAKAEIMRAKGITDNSLEMVTFTTKDNTITQKYIDETITPLVSEMLSLGYTAKQVEEGVKEAFNVIGKVTLFNEAIDKVKSLGAAYLEFYQLQAEGAKIKAGKEAGKEEVARMNAAQKQLKDLTIESTKDRVEQVKLISMASYNEQEEALRASLDQSLITYEQFNTAIGMLEDQRVQKIIAAEAEIAKARLDGFMQWVDMASNTNNAVGTIASNISKVAINNIDAEDKKKRESIEATIKNQKKKDKALKALDEETAARKKAEYEKQKSWSIAQAIIGGAIAIIQGYAQLGPILGSVMAVLTAAVTASEIAVISSQTFASGGFVGGRGGKDSQQARVTPGEAMLNTEQQRRFLDIANGVTKTGNQNITLSDTIIVNGSLDMNAANQIKIDREAQLVRLRNDMRELAYRGQLVTA